jgi:hypothetical protein
MSKPSRGALAAGKKKAKKRPELRPAAPATSTVARSEPVQEHENGSAQVATATPVLQFRPKGRDSLAARPVGGRAAALPRMAQQVVDYSYVYTDLKIIAALVIFLLVMLILLSFVIR